MFDYHRKKGYADLYSLHSWCGILAFVLYVVQVSPSRPTAVGEAGGRASQGWGGQRSGEEGAKIVRVSQQAPLSRVCAHR